MVRYSLGEKQEMYNLYVKCHKNSVEAAREYQRLFPHKHQPDRTVFNRIYRTLTEHGQLYQKRSRYETRQVDNEINVLAQINVDPSGSCRTYSRECGISKSQVNRIIKKFKYHDFKYMPVQTLRPEDYERRVNYCRWLIRQPNDFPCTVLWTDETTFTNCGMFNRRNKHFYATENPHLVQEVRNQSRYSINVWCGLIDNQLVGPFF